MFRRLASAAALLILACAPAAAWTHGSASAPAGCAAGQGGGANLREANMLSPNPSICPEAYYTPGANGTKAVSTADAYFMTGVYWYAPYDLRAFGSQGAAIEAREGKRYVWITGPDHPDASGSNHFAGTVDVWACYSNDPGILPSPTDCTQIIKYFTVQTFSASQVNIRVYHAPSMVYNPDSGGDQIWIYFEASGSGVQHETGLYTTSDLQTMTFLGPATLNENPPGTPRFDGFSSFMRAVRNGPNDWTGYAYSNPTTFAAGISVWTTTDPAHWTTFGPPLGAGILAQQTNPVVSGSELGLAPSCIPRITYQGQTYWLVVEKTRAARFTASMGNGLGGAGSILNVSAVTSGTIEVGFKVTGLNSSGDIRIQNQITGTPGGVGTYQTSASSQLITSRTWQGIIIQTGPYGVISSGGLSYATLWPVNATTNEPLTSPAPIRLTDAFTNIYPGPTYLQDLGCYIENGVMHIYASRGFPSSGQDGLSVPNQPYTAGGALWQQFVDYYSFILDPAAAAQAAPFGLRASTAYGVTTLTWHDALPDNHFRVRRGPTRDGPWTQVADVASTAVTDIPWTKGYFCYQVTTLDSGVERGARVVCTYNEQGATAFVNDHLRRVLEDGGDLTTCNLTWMISADAFLTTNDAWKYLELWTDPDFCMKRDVSGNVLRVYDFGTTLKPRGGDLTFCVTTDSICASGDAAAVSFNPIGINSTAAAWVASANNAHGYYGKGRWNNIQRQSQAMVFAVYQKPGTGPATPLAAGEFKGIYLSHSSGTPGAITFTMSTPASNCPINCVTATTPAPASATATQIVSAYFDGTNMTACLNGTCGSPASATSFSNPGLTVDTVLRGNMLGSGGIETPGPFLGVGSQDAKFSPSLQQYQFDNNEGMFSGGALAYFAVGSSTLAAAMTTLYQTKTKTDTPTYTATINCDNVSDDAKFMAFRTAAIAAQGSGRVQATLSSSSASTCRFTGTTAQGWTAGINNLLVIGNGITMTNGGGSSPGFFLGGGALTDDNTHHATTVTVTAGSSCVTLTTPAQASRFTVGAPALMTGFDVQSSYGTSFGYPINPHFFEYTIIASANAGTGQVCFTTPLSNSYKSTWPLFGIGNALHIQQTGPATLYALPASWNARWEYRNLTVDQTSTNFATQAPGRHVTLNGVTVTSTKGFWPTQNQDFRMINVTMSVAVNEVDKIIGTLYVSGGTIKQFNTQSSSVQRMVFDNPTITTSVTGTGQRFYGAYGSYALLGSGATAYGRSDYTLCMFCNITAFGIGAVLEKGPGDLGVNVTYSMAGGTISYPTKTDVTGADATGCGGDARLTVASSAGFVSNQLVNISGVGGTTEVNGGSRTITVPDATHVCVVGVSFANPWTSGGTVGNNAPRWAIPGTNVCWSGSAACERMFQVSDVTQGATGSQTISVTTSESGGFPTLPLGGGTKLYLQVHPAPRFECVSCTGALDAVAVDGRPEEPLYAYNKRTYTGALGTTTQTPFSVWGQGVSITYDVTAASALATQNFAISQFANMALLKSDGTNGSYGGIVNAKIVATRVHTPPSGITGGQASDCSGAGTDCLTFDEPFWFSGAAAWLSGPKFSASDAANCPGANCPSVTLILRGDQGVKLP